MKIEIQQMVSRPLFRVCSLMSNMPKEYYPGDCHRDEYGDGILIDWYVVGRRYPLVTYDDVETEDCTEAFLDYCNEHFSKSEADLLSQYLAERHSCDCRTVPAFTGSHERDTSEFIPFTVTTEVRMWSDKYTYAFHRDRTKHSYTLSNESSYSLPFKVYGHYADHGHVRPMAPAGLILKQNLIRSEYNRGCCGKSTVLNVPKQVFYTEPFADVPLCDSCGDKHISKQRNDVVVSESPELYPTQDSQIDTAFGVCPYCNCCGGRLFDGEVVWLFCSKHKAKWPISTGHFICHGCEDSLEYAYRNLLTEYKIVEPVLEKSD